LLFGGYVYFDRAGTIVQVNGVGGGQGLHFSQPQKWKKEFTSQLRAQGRFQDITIKSMLDQGAQQFCWIRPNETLYDSTLTKKWECCQNGAFAYLFHDDKVDHDERNCFFAIVDVTEVYHSTENFPAVGVTPFSIARGNKNGAQHNVTQCVSCNDKSREVIFGPCNHFVTCKDCAKDLTACPICTLQICTKGNVFT